ncbi:MAG: DUF3387 domain-containing protein [Burkholderiaceae bacterium]
MTAGVEWILDKQQQWAAAEKTPGQVQAQRRFADGVLSLSKAFAGGKFDEARGIREEVGFFQAIRAALVKTAGGSGTARQDRELAIQQIVSRAVVSTEIVDILGAAGIQTPDLPSSDEFLPEVQQMDKKNSSALRNRSMTASARAPAPTWSRPAPSPERLRTPLPVTTPTPSPPPRSCRNWIKLAQDIRAARNRGEEQGLHPTRRSPFYDAGGKRIRPPGNG